MFQLHSETSKDAFSKVDVEKQENDILNAFYEFGHQGATCEQVHKKLKAMYHQWSNRPIGTVSARMSGMKGKTIFWKNQVRVTESGANAEVWVSEKFATDKEREWTSRRPATKRQNIEEIMKNVQRFLQSMEKANAVDGVWLKGMKHNIEQLDKALEFLK